MLFQIDRLKERESLPLTTAIRRIAKLRGLTPEEEETFVSRLRAKFARKRKAGTLPKTEPVPAVISEAIDRAYKADRDQAEALVRDAYEAEETARGLGLDVSGDLESLFVELRRERDSLEDIAMAHGDGLAWRLQERAKSPEEAKEIYQRTMQRYRELTEKMTALSPIIRYRRLLGAPEKDPSAS